MKIIKNGQEARDALKRGIDLACNLAKVTLGPTGRNAILGRIDIPPISTNDGVSVVRNVEVEDEIENQGVWIVKEACSVASGKAGDGTTTTAVLLQAIVSELFEKIKDNGSLVSKKVNVIQLMKDFDLDKEVVIQELVKRARPITDEEIYNVAMVSGEFEWLANIISKIYKEIGKDGHVTIQEGNKTKYEVFKGIEFNAGYQSEYFINNDNRECVLKNPAVLVTNQALGICEEITNIATKLSGDESEGLIIIAPDFTKDLINRLNTTKLKANFNIVALRLPMQSDDLLKDIATLTNAKFLDKNLYNKTEDYLADIKMESLGTCGESITSESKTVFVGGQGDTTERIKVLKEKIEQTQSLFDKDSLEKRLAYLSGGIATLTIGGDSDFEKGYFKLKAENAVNSVQNALKGGVVKGGGITLKEIAESLPENLLANALKKPYEQLKENAGGEIEVNDSIIDPVDTVISSLKSACSLASRVLTTEVVIAFKNEPKNKDQN